MHTEGPDMTQEHISTLHECTYTGFWFKYWWPHLPLEILTTAKDTGKVEATCPNHR
jgi:hypothetical protein